MRNRKVRNSYPVFSDREDKTPLIPQLAEPMNLAHLVRYCADDRWVATQKCDGQRRLILVDDGAVTALNRNGEPTSLPRLMRRQFERLTRGCWAFDGELLPGMLVVFDMPAAGDRVNCWSPYHQRRRLLEGIFPAWRPGPYIQLLPAAWGHEQKVKLATRLIGNNAEGLILNHVDGVYESGRRSKAMIKAKFRHQLDAVVVDVGRDGKDNMTLAVYDGDQLVEVGEVTALAGTGRQAVAQYQDWSAGVDGVRPPVVEVTYLTGSDDRKLIQPTLPRLRAGDKLPEQCVIGQMVIGNKAIVRL